MTQRFRSEPALAPAAATVTRSPGESPDGQIFLAPQQGPGQSGPMIINQRGQLIWFKPLPSKIQAADFRVRHTEANPFSPGGRGTSAGARAAVRT